MEVLVATVVIAPVLCVLCVTFGPRRVVAGLIIPWAIATAALIAMFFISDSPYAAAGAGVLALLFGMPGLCVLSVIWLALRPRHRCPSCDPQLRSSLAVCPECAAEIDLAQPVAPPRHSRSHFTSGRL